MSMPERERDIEIPLSHLGDALRVRFVLIDGRVAWFTVQFEALVDEIVTPVVHYDTVHGHAHRDILDWDGSTRHTDPMTGHEDYAATMDAAIQDLESNWERYRFDFLRRRP
jgi:hypothetical protein